MVLKGLVVLLRPKQWIKNLFVFAPLLYSGEFANEMYLFLSCVCFVTFCLASSATYVLNDYLDREADRKHPIKCKSRPIAAGIVKEKQAIMMLLSLYAFILIIVSAFPQLILPVACYLVLNVVYCFYLKHQPVLDIFSIASGFVLRVYGGASVINVDLSNWMFITTLSLALFLAAIKRKKEYENIGDTARKSLKKYNVEVINKFVDISAMSTIMFYSMFSLTQKENLVVTTPLVLFGVFRYIYITTTSSCESPTEVLLSDHLLKLTILIWLSLSCALILLEA